MEGQALQRACGELNHRWRPGREANVHRLSVVMVQNFGNSAKRLLDIIFRMDKP